MTATPATQPPRFPKPARLGGTGMAITLLAIMVTGAGASGASAAESDSTLSENLVTATKTDRSIRELSSAATIIDRDRIERSGATTVDQVLQGTPGAYAARMDVSAPNRIAQVYLRGLPGNGRSLVLIDGIPMNVLYDSQVDWSQLGTVDVERIEVVRGAGSALYGNHAMGGVVNIISKLPAPGVSTRVEGGAGSLNTGRGAFLISNRDGKSALSLSTSYLSSDGYNMWPANTTTPKAQQANMGTIKNNTGASYFREIDPNNLLDFKLSYLRDRATGLYNIPGYVAQDREQYLGSSRFRHFGQGSETTVQLYTRVGLMYADSTNGTNCRSDGCGGAGQLANTPGVGAATLIAYHGKFDDRETGLTAHSSHVVGNNQKVTFGGEFVDGKMTMTNIYPQETGRRQVTSGTVGRAGLFVQDEIALERLRIDLALRWDRWKTSGSFSDTQTTFPGQGTWGERQKSSVSPKTGVSYTLGESTNLRASLGKSFNTPDVSQLYGQSRRSGTTVAYGNPQLNPETAISRDIGADYYVGKTAYLKATLFHTTAKDFIGTLQRAGAAAGTTDKINYGGIRAKGIELEAMWRLSDAIRLSGGINANSSIITKYDQNPALVGARLSNVPSQSASLRADADIAAGMTAYAVANRVGNRFSSEAVGATYYRPYGTVDLGMMVPTSKDTTTRFTITNLTDSHYDGIGYSAPGRTIMVDVIGKF